RGLCCFPSLSAKKPNQSLLSDQVSVLSTNNSDMFLQLAHYDQRERELQEHQENQTKQTKSEDIVLLEKQGRCSQKLRSNATGNLAQVTHTVGQNMTDISNIGNPLVPKIVTNITQNLSNIKQNGILPPRLKERSGSLPPSALPRPPRSIKPPRKIDYDRLSDTELKCRAQTPPKSSNPNQSKYDMKSNTMKRNEIARRDYSPGKSFLDVKDTLAFPKPDFSLKRKEYGSFSKPEFTSTKNYQRLEDSPKAMKANQDAAYKRSLLPSSRNKYSTGTNNSAKNSRDSLNSSESNNSTNSNPRSSPVHIKTDSSTSNNTYHSRTPPKYLPPISPQEKSFLAARQHNNQRQQQIKAVSVTPTCTGNSSSASLPPKPND
ncbi:hypothetical protein Bhyg_06385, partial [Pseudolycoriella hygida]